MNVTLVQKVVARISRGFVLAFHDIPAAKMEQLIDSLWPIQPVHLADLVDRSKEHKTTAGLCAITVDDGVGETVGNVTALCRRRAWPVTFYLPTGNLDTREGMVFEWWRKIRPMLAGRRVKTPLATFDCSSPGKVAELSATWERLWHTAPLAAYRPLMMQMVAAAAEAAGIGIEELRPDPPVSWQEVETLSRDELFRFESHGVSHVAMSALSEDDLVMELKQSRDTVTEHAGRPCRHLAYPFGNPLSIGPAAPLLARRYYDSAVTMGLGHVDSADPWLMPRIPLYPENSTSFARAKVVLKSSRLAGAPARRDVFAEEQLAASSETAGSPQ